jgi:hypothetical protein
MADDIIDCSHYQGQINWDQVKRDGVIGAMIKTTEGLGYVDPAWTDHYAGAGSVGIARGPYHFADLADPVAEANHFCDVAGIHNWELLYTGDIEKAGATGAWTVAFRNQLRLRTGRAWWRAYSSYSLLIGAMNPNVWYDAATSIWAARYNTTLGWDHAGLELWQNTDAATVPGILGHVDEEQRLHGWSPSVDMSRTGVIHTPPAPTPPAPHPVTGKLPANTVLKMGSRGAAVSLLQRTLNTQYPAYSHLAVDGDYGPATLAVVREFQSRAHLAVDGIAGPATLRALHLV